MASSLRLKSASGLFLWCLFLFHVLRALCGRSVSYWWRFFHSVSSRCRSIPRLNVLWGLSWRAGLLGLGAYFAVTSTAADYLNRTGCATADIARIEQAARLFPYDWFIRTKPGYFYIETRNMSFRAEAEIARVLETDPYSVDLLTGLYWRQLVLGDTSQALETSQLVRRLAPKAVLIKQLEGSNP